MDEEQHLPPAQRHRVEREEVAGHDAGGLPAQELTPGGRGTPWRGLDAVGPEHLGCRAGRHPMPEADQLTLDALLPPSRVVDSQPHDQSGEHLGHRGPADAAVGIGPAPGNQAAMPAKQRLGPHAERRPALPAQKPSSARQARPHRPARGEAAAAGGAGSQARGAAPGSRSPWTRCAGAPTPRATARGRRRGTPTTILRNRDDLAGARRRRTVVGSIEGANSLVHDFNRVFGPYGPGRHHPTGRRRRVRSGRHPGAAAADRRHCVRRRQPPSAMPPPHPFRPAVEPHHH